MASGALAEVAALFPTAKNGAVAQPSARVVELCKLRELPRALMAGTHAMRDAAEKWLPRHPNEAQEDYNTRLAGTFLFGAFEQAVIRQGGKFFGEPVVLNDDVPEKLVELCDNIDGQGRDITAFAVDLAREAFVDGVSYILADFPKMPAGATLADQRRLQARPYWVLVCADQILGWRVGTVKGAPAVTQVRIRECTYEADGRFGERRVERVRVLEPGTYTVFEEKVNANSEKEWVEVDRGETSLDYIPIAPFYTNRTAYFEGEPPLRALGETCQEHWISSSEQRHALTFLRFAMLALSGVEDAGQVVVGPNKILALPMGATAQYVEHSGAGVAAGFQDLEAIEKRMQTTGMELRVENAGKQTATAAAIDSTESNAALKAVGRGLQDTLDFGLQMLADFLKLGSGGTTKIYDQFAEQQAAAADATSLLQMVSAHALSRAQFWEELKRRGILAEDFDADVETARLEDEVSRMVALEQPPEPPQAPPKAK